MKLTELTENKKALGEIGAGRIKQNDITPTLSYFAKLSGVPIRHLHKIGSTGKLASSGDIDIAIDTTIHKHEKVHTTLVSALGADKVTSNHGTGVTSYAIPIKGDEKNGLVQVDVMYVANVEWAKFSYHSAGDRSRYKGAVRTILISAVAAALNTKGTDYFEYTDDGSLSIRAGRSLDLNQGLRRIFQYLPDRKDGKGKMKNMKSIPIDDFKEMFPEVEVNNGQVIIDEPERVVKMLFGGSVTPSDVESAEQVLSLIKRKFSDEEQTKIFDIARKRAKGLSAKMRLPAEISDETE
jgi:hypothetical protein